MDVSASEREPANPQAVGGSGKRNGRREAARRGFRVDLEQVVKTKVPESLRKLLRHYGRHGLILAVVLLLVHDVFGAHGFLAMRRKQQEIRKVSVELGRLNKENGTLQKDVQDLRTDPQTIRKIAREELGLARPGEVVIKLPAPAPESPAGAP